MTEQEQAHRRLLDAVNSYVNADQNGSKQEIRDAVAELHASRGESQKVLYPNKLTVGDCVIILGKPWAGENGINTAGDLLRPAPPEWADLARQTYAARKSIAEAKEVATTAQAKQGRKR